MRAPEGLWQTAAPLPSSTPRQRAFADSARDLPPSLGDFFERGRPQSNRGRCRLQHGNQLLARNTKLLGLAVLQTGDVDQRFQTLDLLPDRRRELRIACLDGPGENGPIGQLDPIYIVAHVVERSAAETRFAAIRFALADL